MDHGYRSLGKYSSARDSLLHFMCINGWQNDSDGNVEAPTGYFYELVNGPADVNPRNTEVSSLFEEWFNQNPEVTDSEELRSELIGLFIVTEDNQGFVTVEEFDDPQGLAQRWLSLQEALNEWEREDED